VASVAESNHARQGRLEVLERSELLALSVRLGLKNDLRETVVMSFARQDPMNYIPVI
jgi:hypothetical protein